MKPTLSQLNLDAGLGGNTLTTDTMRLKSVTAPSVSLSDSTQLYAEDMTDNDLKLLLKFNGTDGATTTRGNSERGHPVTFVSGAKITTAEKKFGTGSFLFNGSTDTLTVPDSNDWDIYGSLSGEWTIDMWVKHNSMQNCGYIGSGGGGVTTYWHFGYSGGLWLYWRQNGVTRYSTIGGTISDTNWHHVAFIIKGNGSTLYVAGYLDGVRVVNNSTTIIGTVARVLTIGERGLSDYYYDGYMDELRIVNGNPFNADPSTADTITVPTSEHATDADTRLLLHANGVNGQTSTIDDSNCGNPVTLAGTAQLDTGAYKFGTASLLLDGDSDYAVIPNQGEFDICASATDIWTIDLWIKCADHAGNEYLISQTEDGGNRWFLVHNGDNGGLRFYAESASSAILDTGFAGEITDTNWHHIALIKVADEWGIYKDGVQVNYIQDSDTATMDGPLTIGAYDSGSSSWFQGHIDCVRMIKSNPFEASPQSDNSDTITVPTSEYDSGVKSELRVRDETGNVTTLSPHNFSLIPGGKSEANAFSYYSEYNGMAINVDMMKALRELEILSGEKLIYIKDKKTGEIT